MTNFIGIGVVEVAKSFFFRYPLVRGDVTVHQHASTNESTRTRLLIAAGITLVVLLAQLIGSIISGSLALAADTGHVAIDSIGLFLAAFTATLMTRPASGELTYGYARLEAIAGGIQAGMIIIICTIIGYQAVIRLITPTAVDGTQMAAWAVAGLLGNLASMLVMLGHHRDNLNIKAAFLEVSVDAISSVGVIAGGIITRFSGITRVDAVISLLIASAMLPRGYKLLKDAGAILLERTPSELKIAEIRNHILQVEHVSGIHDLHVWPLNSQTVLLSAHIIIAKECYRDGHALEVLHQVEECMKTHFPRKIEHCTLQIEPEGHAAHETLKH